jgi:hypothetical protein
MSISDFCFALDRVAEGQALGTNSQALATENLACARQIEITAEFRESGNDFRRGVGFDRVEDRRLRKGGAERVMLRSHDVEIDGDARGFWAALGKKTVDAVDAYPMRRMQWSQTASGLYVQFFDHDFSSQ